MKKAILIVCVLALLVAASAAFAGDGSRVFLAFKAGWYDGASTGANSTASFGAGTSTQTANATYGASSYNVAATDGSTKAWITDKVLGTVGGSYSFQLVVAAGTGATVLDHTGDAHAGMCYISAWNLDQWVALTGCTLPANYQVTVSGSHVFGGSVSWAAPSMFLTAANAPAATAIGPVGFWYNYGGANGHYSNFSDAITAGQTFTVTVAPAPPDTPEPGSLLALGSGMMGLVGFAIRRRRA